MSVITKIVRKGSKDYNTCVQIYANHYDASLKHILEMSNILKKDFNLEDSQIAVQKFGGQRIKGITVVEAFIPHTIEIPSDYTEVKQIEVIL